MEQEDRDRLIRIDERTARIEGTLEQHIANDRADFKEVHSRINRIVARVIGIAVLVVGGVLGSLAPWWSKGG